MKKIKTFFVMAIAVMMMASTCLMLAACGEKTPKPDDGALVDGKAVVKFDSNLEGTMRTEENITKVQEQKKTPGEKLTRVRLVVKDANANIGNFAFKEWCTDKEGTTPWDFDTPVQKSMTLYAKWEVQCQITYNVAGLDTPLVSNVFKGEKAPRRDSDVGWKKIVNWCTDSEFKNEYDFNKPVNSNLTLYAKLEPGVFINGSRLTTFTVGYHGENDDDSTITLEESGGEEYARVHYARVWDNGAAWITYTNFNQRITTYNPEVDAEKDRFGDQITITFKNLGKSTHFRMYFIVCYDKQGGGFLYSSGHGMVEGSTGPGWSTLVQLQLREDQIKMSADDEWTTLTINLAEATNNGFGKNGGSEWGTADLISNLRFDFCEYENGKSLYDKGNDILIKEIAFTPGVATPPAEEQA